LANHRVASPDEEGKRRRVIIGEFTSQPAPGKVTLKQAHGWKEELAAAQKLGPGHLAAKVAELEKAKAIPVAPRAAKPGERTVNEEIDAFMAVRMAQRRHPEDAKRAFDADVRPAIGNRALEQITAAEVGEVVAAVVARGSKVSAGHLLALLRQLFSWSVDVGHLKQSPIASVFKDPTSLGCEKAERRERILSREELPRFIAALRQAGPRLSSTIRAGLQLLLLLGVRSGELRQAKWDEMDLAAGEWHIPKEHVKGSKRHPAKSRVCPLPPTATELLKALQGEAKLLASAYVLPSPYGGGELTDHALNKALHRLRFADDLVVHDLRRTALSYWVDDAVGAQWHIAEVQAGHTLPGESARYMRGDLLADRRRMLEKWDAFIGSLVRGEATVTTIRGRQ